MIFSNQDLHRAFAYKGKFYNKILLVNLDDGSFTPIKVDNDEWMKLNKTYNFSKWVEDFVESNKFIAGARCGHGDFIRFNDILRLKTLKRPDRIKYYKKIGLSIHEVESEIVPVNEHECYIFVDDLDKVIEEEQDA